MAADDVPRAGWAAFFRRDVLSSGRSPGDARLPANPGRGVAGISRQGEGSYQQSREADRSARRDYQLRSDQRRPEAGTGERVGASARVALRQYQWRTGSGAEISEH